MSSFLHSVANGIRNLGSSAEEQIAREQVKAAIPMAKLAAVVTVAVTALFFAIFPNIFTGTLLALTGYGAYEICNMLNNLHEVADRALAEVRVRWSEANARNHLFKGAPLGRIIFDVVAPPRILT